MLIVCAHCLVTNRLAPARATENPVCGNCKKFLLDGNPIDLNDENFERVISKTELPIVVDFWAAWCGPCQAMAPHFQQAAARLAGRVLFAKVDSDANQKTSARFAIRSIPTLVLFRQGQEIKRQSGALQTAQILTWIETA